MGNGHGMTSSELFYLTLGATMALGLFTFPRELVMKGGFDAYYGLLLAWALGLAAAWMSVRWGQLFPGLSAIGSFKIALGWLAYPVLLAEIAFTLAFVGFAARNFLDLLKSVFFPVTPEVVLIVALLGLSAYQAQQGIFGIARSAEIVLGLAVLVTLAIYSFALTKVYPPFIVIHAPHLLPVVESGFATFYLFLNVHVLLMVTPFVKRLNLGPRAVFLAFVVLLGIAYLVLVNCVGSFGFIGVLRVAYPPASVLRLLRVEGFLIERLGILVLVGNIVLVYINLALNLWAMTTATIELTGLPRAGRPWITLGWTGLAVVISLLVPNTAAFIKTFPYFTALGFLAAIGVPMTIHAVAWARGLGLGRRNGPYGAGRAKPPRGIILWGEAVTGPGSEAEDIIGDRAVARWKARLEAGTSGGGAGRRRKNR